MCEIEYANIASNYRDLEQNLYFHGAIQDDEKTGELLYASDLLVIPGYVGLSVNHALNFDCPVVTLEQKKDGPYHSPEISYIVDGETGFIVHNHTPEAIANTIENYLTDEHLQSKMKTYIRTTVKTRCSIQNFIQGFKDATDFVSKK